MLKQVFLFKLIFPLLALALPASGSFAQTSGRGKEAQRPFPVDPPAYVKAFSLLQGGKAAEALAVIDAALVEFPNNPGLYNLRGLAAGQLGRAKEAEASFRKVIELSPHTAMGYNNLATVYSQQGRHAEAEKLFQQALKHEPQNFTALLGLGMTLATLREYAAASLQLEKAWRVNPKDFQTGYELARVLHEMRRPTEARKVLEQVTPPKNAAAAAKYFTLSAVLAEDQSDFPLAVRLYQRAYELAPESFEIYLALARASLKTGVPAADRSLPAAPPNLSAEEHFTLGLLFSSRGAYGDAVPHFEQALRMEPASYSAAYNLAVSYKGAGKTEAAIRLIENTLEKRPTAELYNLLASLHESAGRYVEAVRHYQKAVELEPTNEQYYFDLGLEYLAHFTFGPALEVFQAGVQKFPTSFRQYEGNGLAQYALREYSEAANAFLAALEINPASPTAYAAWNALSSTLRPAELEEMLRRLRRLSELHPKNAEVQYCYGQALLTQGLSLNQPENVNLAKPFIDQAISLKPSLSEAHLALGNFYAAQRENQKAVEAFRETLRLAPKSEMAHYRLGQTYRNLNELELAEQELARYAELVRNRREQMARSRSAIKQFVLTHSGSSHGTAQDGVKQEASQ
jgi:tetratricopeptide (TPR) repeat protein